MRRFHLLLLAFLSGWPALKAQRVAQVPAGGGLQMGLARDFRNGEVPRFRLSLHNGTAGGLLVEIGTMGGNGRQQFLDGFRYVLRLPDGHLARLSVRVPASLFGAPRPEPLTVPLAPEATLDLPVNFAVMLLERGDAADWRVRLAPGAYAFWVEYEHTMPATRVQGPGVLPEPMLPYWVGTLRTAPIAFVINP